MLVISFNGNTIDQAMNGRLWWIKHGMVVHHNLERHKAC